MTRTTAKRPTAPSAGQAGTAVFFLALTWLALAAFGIYSWRTGRNMSVLGQFGDMFGVLNGLFTALAFGFVAWNALMQRSALDVQQQALEAQERELRDTRQVMARQAFESTFFQMLRQVRDLHQALRAQHGLQGASAMRAFAEESGEVLSAGSAAWLRGDRDKAKELIGATYVERVYKDHEAELGPYFRTLYHVFRLIDRQQYPEEETARTYANMARAHLSGDALVVLAMNCCSEYGEGFRNYVNRFGLLKHYPDRRIAAWLSEGLFLPSAFEGATAPTQPEQAPLGAVAPRSARSTPV